MISPILVENVSSVVVRPCVPDKKRPPWCRDHVYINMNVEKLLEKELVEFGQWAQLSKQELAMRAVVIRRFQSVCKLIFPNAKLFCYGSTATHTSLNSGDIDLCITDLPEEIDVNTALEIFVVQSEIYHLFDSVKHIKHAKVPILKGVESMYHFNIDISAKEPNSLFNIERNNNVLRVYPSIFPVLMLMKIVLLKDKMNETYSGGISSSILFNMVHFIVQISPPKYKNNPAKILMGFLSTYGLTFNFCKNIISTVNGGSIVQKEQGDIHIQCVDPQNPDTIMSGNNRLHRQILETFARLNDLLRKDYSPFDSLLARIIDVEKVNLMDEKRKERINTFIFHTNKNAHVQQNIITKPRMPWEVLSEFVVAQTEYIKKKHALQFNENMQISDENIKTCIPWQAKLREQYIKKKDGKLLQTSQRFKEHKPPEEKDKLKSTNETESTILASQIDYVNGLLDL